MTTEAAALATIRDEIRNLVTHPRMKNKSFGEVSALELLVRLSEYLDKQPVVRWPAREQERAT